MSLDRKILGMLMCFPSCRKFHYLDKEIDYKSLFDKDMRKITDQMKKDLCNKLFNSTFKRNKWKHIKTLKIDDENFFVCYNKNCCGMRQLFFEEPLSFDLL